MKILSQLALPKIKMRVLWRTCSTLNDTYERMAAILWLQLNSIIGGGGFATVGTEYEAVLKYKHKILDLHTEI